MNVNQKPKYPDREIVDLTSNVVRVYIEKDYRNYTLEEDGVEFVKVQQACSGCFPIFMNNQLAHMDVNGCLHQEWNK